MEIFEENWGDRMKGISTVIATILMLMFTFLGAGFLTYIFITRMSPSVEEARLCEAYCIKNNIQFNTYDKGNYLCYCFDCNENLLLDKNVTFCENKIYKIKS